MADVYNAVMLFGVLLLAGMVIRELIPALGKFMIPSSIIGGFLGLILGQQVIGLIEIPDVFSQISSWMPRIVMTVVPIGVAVSGKKIIQQLDFTFANMTMYGFQMAIGLLVGNMFCQIWPGLPENWGILGVAAFFGSHGTIPTVAPVLDPDGTTAMMDIGMVLASFGVLAAIIPGMIMANFGVRRGWGTFVTDMSSQPASFYRGVLAKEDQKPIGIRRVSANNVSAIALALAYIGLCYKFGGLVMKGVGMVVPFVAQMSAMLYGLFGALILWPITCKLGLDKYFDVQTIQELGSCAVELTIVTALATIQISVIATFLAPILLFCLIFLGATFIFVFWYMKFIGNPQWFEKALMVWGMTSGSNPQGYALVRAVDPNNESCIYEAVGVYNAVFFWNKFIATGAAAGLALGSQALTWSMGIPLMCTFIIGILLFKTHLLDKMK